VDKKVPVKLWKSSGSEVRIWTPDTDSGSWPWWRSGLSDYSC